MKRTFLALTAFVICLSWGFPSLAADPPAKSDSKEIAGIWEGTLKAGATELRLAFTISVDAKGKLVCLMDSIDQGASKIPCEEITYEQKKLTIKLESLKASYSATMLDSGEGFKGTFQQSGLKMPLELKRVKEVSKPRRPQTPKKPYPYLEEEVTYENKKAGFKLGGTLTLPKSGGPFPAVVLVTGSGAQDRDETLLGHKPFLIIADYLTRHGIAVLRFDDRGVGKSGGNHAIATSADFADDTYAGVQFLKTRKEIDPKRIGIVGHSEGGVIAPMVVANHPADVGFIVLLAGPGIPGNEILIGQHIAILKAMGVPKEKVALQSKIQSAAVNAVLHSTSKEKMRDEIRAAIKKTVDSLSDDERKLIEEEIKATEAIVKALDSEWMIYFLKFDPKSVLKKVQCPVLAVNGALDLQVLPTENMKGIEEAIQSNGNKKLTTKIFPKLNHLFQKAKTGAPTEYAQIEETFSEEVLEFLAKWISEIK